MQVHMYSACRVAVHARDSLLLALQQRLRVLEFLLELVRLVVAIFGRVLQLLLDQPDAHLLTAQLLLLCDVTNTKTHRMLTSHFTLMFIAPQNLYQYEGNDKHISFLGT